MNETTPYFEDNNRKGSTRGEAMFGDKHAQFEVTSVGEQELNVIDQEATNHDVSVNRMGELAARQLSIEEFSRQHPDMDQDRIEAIYKARTH